MLQNRISVYLKLKDFIKQIIHYKLIVKLKYQVNLYINLDSLCYQNLVLHCLMCDDIKNNEKKNQFAPDSTGR